MLDEEGGPKSAWPSGGGGGLWPGGGSDGDPQSALSWGLTRDKRWGPDGAAVLRGGHGGAGGKLQPQPPEQDSEGRKPSGGDMMDVVNGSWDPGR